MSLQRSDGQVLWGMFSNPREHGKCINASQFLSPVMRCTADTVKYAAFISLVKGILRDVFKKKQIISTREGTCTYRLSENLIRDDLFQYCVR